MTQQHKLLRFDSRIGGSKEHFLHFMLGYLLPVLSHTMKEQSKFASGEHKEALTTKFLIESCGPVMDNISTQMLNLIGTDFEILEEAPTSNEVSETVPRWDHWLVYMHAVLEGDLPKVLYKFILNSAKTEKELNADISLLREFFLTAVKQLDSETDFSDHYVILKRSDPPKFYQKDGGAEEATYGTTRRSLNGIEEAAQFANEKGIPVRIFEAGKYGILDQIRAFSTCKGVVGVRGAEFANLVWMRPGSKVMLVVPSNMNTPSVPKSLAKVLKLDYFEEKTFEGKHPNLNKESLCEFLSSK